MLSIIIFGIYFKNSLVTLTFSHSDFDAYYNASQKIIDGINIYENPFTYLINNETFVVPYIYPPFFAFLLSKINPFFSYDELKLLFLALTFLMVPCLTIISYFIGKKINTKLNFNKFYIVLFFLILLSSSMLCEVANGNINLIIFFYFTFYFIFN